jgi:hypothetical protein
MFTGDSVVIGEVAPVEPVSPTQGSQVIGTSLFSSPSSLFFSFLSFPYLSFPLYSIFLHSIYFSRLLFSPTLLSPILSSPLLLSPLILVMYQVWVTVLRTDSQVSTHLISNMFIFSPLHSFTQ